MLWHIERETNSLCSKRELRETSALQEHDHRDNGHLVLKGSDNHTKACTTTSHDSPSSPPNRPSCQYLRNSSPLQYRSSTSIYSSSLCNCTATESSQLISRERTNQTSNPQALCHPARPQCFHHGPADRMYSRTNWQIKGVGTVHISD